MKYTFPRTENPVTATQIAAAIPMRPDRYGFAKALRQVQHWTDNRLLKPSGQIRTGTGVAREYPRKPTIPIAAIFQELVLLEFTIEQLRPVGRYLYGDSAADDKREGLGLAAALNNRRSQLLLGFEVNAKGSRTLRIVSLLDAIEDRAQREARQLECRSSTLINLAPVLDRIKWPT